MGVFFGWLDFTTCGSGRIEQKYFPGENNPLYSNYINMANLDVCWLAKTDTEEGKGNLLSEGTFPPTQPDRVVVVGNLPWYRRKHVETCQYTSHVHYSPLDVPRTIAYPWFQLGVCRSAWRKESPLFPPLQTLPYSPSPPSTGTGIGLLCVLVVLLLRGRPSSYCHHLSWGRRSVQEIRLHPSQSHRRGCKWWDKEDWQACSHLADWRVQWGMVELQDLSRLPQLLLPVVF